MTTMIWRTATMAGCLDWRGRRFIRFAGGGRLSEHDDGFASLWQSGELHGELLYESSAFWELVGIVIFAACVMLWLLLS